MKKIYTKPEAMIAAFDSSDIITTSGIETTEAYQAMAAKSGIDMKNVTLVNDALEFTF